MADTTVVFKNIVTGAAVPVKAIDNQDGTYSLQIVSPTAGAAVKPFAALLEGGVTELIGADEQVDAQDYAGSIGVALGGAYSGEILSFALYSYKTGSGSVQVPAGKVYVFDADPAIAAGDTALAAAGAEHKTVLGTIAISSTDWLSDTNGAVAFKSVAIPFHAVSTLYFTFRPDSGATSLNDGAGDNEVMDFNFWYRRDS